MNIYSKSWLKPLLEHMFINKIMSINERMFINEQCSYIKTYRIKCCTNAKNFTYQSTSIYGYMFKNSQHVDCWEIFLSLCWLSSLRISVSFIFFNPIFLFFDLISIVLLSVSIKLKKITNLNEHKFKKKTPLNQRQIAWNTD